MEAVLSFDIWRQRFRLDYATMCVLVTAVLCAAVPDCLFSDVEVMRASHMAWFQNM